MTSKENILAIAFVMVIIVGVGLGTILCGNPSPALLKRLKTLLTIT